MLGRAVSRALPSHARASAGRLPQAVVAQASWHFRSFASGRAATEDDKDAAEASAPADREERPSVRDMEALLGDTGHGPDPVFERNARAVEQMKRMPEPFRTQLLQKLVVSMPAEKVLDLGQYDEELAEFLRREQMRRMTSVERDEVVPPNPYMSNVKYDSKYFTSKRNPADHDRGTAGRYYVLDEDATRLFPEGFPKGLQEEFQATQREALMVREIGLDVRDRLRRFADVTGSFFAENASPADNKDIGDAYPEFAQRSAVLAGPRGVGKTATLIYLLHYARANGWITLFVPFPYRLLHHGLLLTPSETRPGFVDQNDFATEMLTHTLELHGEQLATVPQRGKYRKDRYLPAQLDEETQAYKAAQLDEERQSKERLRMEASRKGEVWDESAFESPLEQEMRDTSLDRSSFTLRDMLEWGLAHPSAATDTLLALKDELKQVTEFPVLVAVDGVNELYESSSYPFAGKLPWPSHLLSIPRAFRAYNKHGFDAEQQQMRRGMFLSSTTFTHRMHPRIFDPAIHPRNRIPGHELLWVPRLSRQEVHNQMLHYHFTGRFLELRFRADVDSHTVEYFRTLSSGLPREIRRMANLLFDK